MKLTFNTKEFIDTMSKVFKATPKKGTLPILEFAEFVIIGNHAQIRASDQEVTIEAYMEVTSNEDVTFLMHHDIMGLVNTIKDEYFTLDYDPEILRLTVITSSGTYKFPTLNPEEYLAKQEPEGTSLGNFAITSEQLKHMYSTIAIACSEDEFRPAMAGIFLEFKKDKLMMTATDSFRLIHFEDNASYDTEQSVILPKETVELMKMFDGDVTMNIFGNEADKIRSNTVSISSNQIKMTSRVIKEQYVSYDSVLPDNQHSILFDPKQMKDALIRLQYTIGASNQVQFKIDGENGTCVIASSDEDAAREGQEEIGIQGCNTDMNIGFNHQYLLPFISKMTDGGIVKMTFSEPSRPACLHPEPNNEKDRIFLIMPVRI